jgi:hypothetical protein
MYRMQFGCRVAAQLESPSAYAICGMQPKSYGCCSSTGQNLGRLQLLACMAWTGRLVWDLHVHVLQ